MMSLRRTSLRIFYMYTQKQSKKRKSHRAKSEKHPHALVKFCFNYNYMPFESSFQKTTSKSENLNTKLTNYLQIIQFTLSQTVKNWLFAYYHSLSSHFQLIQTEMLYLKVMAMAISLFVAH